MGLEHRHTWLVLQVPRHEEGDVALVDHLGGREGISDLMLLRRGPSSRRAPVTEGLCKDLPLGSRQSGDPEDEAKSQNNTAGLGARGAGWLLTALLGARRTVTSSECQVCGWKGPGTGAFACAPRPLVVRPLCG